MSYLLDTNVISETVRQKPDARVMEWLRTVPDDALYVSVISLGEIRRGVERLGGSRRREKLRTWLEHELPAWFGSRVLAIDLAVADRWGRMMAHSGPTMPAIEGLLAATALHHELRLVTRNEEDFEFSGLEVVNPWSSRASD